VTIADFVADARAETPSAAADMAVPDIPSVQKDVERAFQTITEGLHAMLAHMRLRMDACAMPHLAAMLEGRLEMCEVRASGVFASARLGAEAAVKEGHTAADAAYARLRSSDPARIMSMGYAALMKGGRPVRSVSELAKGDAVTARLADGSAALTVDGVRSGGDNSAV
jgi:exodeoxyribonuclease VII large subunit